MQPLVQFQFRNVDLDVFRQVFRQAAYLDLGELHRDLAALLPDAHGHVPAQKMQRHIEADFLVLADPQKVQVQHLPPGRVTLQILDHHRLRNLPQRQREDARIEGFLLHFPEQPGMVEDHGPRLAAATVDDGGHLALPAQSPAAARAQVGPVLDIQRESGAHLALPSAGAGYYQ